MLRSIASLYEDVQFSVKFADGLLPAFHGDTGVRQGCPLSPFLFGVFIEMLHDKIRDCYPEGIGPSIGTPDAQRVHIPILMYADDIVLLGLDAAQLQHLLNILHDFCLEHDMQVSDDKTEVVVFHKTFMQKRDKNFQHYVGHLNVKYAVEYKYLGLIFDTKGQPSKLMHDAALRGTRAKGALYRLYGNLGVSSNIYLKLRLYKALMLPNLTYGCEVWGQQLLQLDPKNPFNNPVDQVTSSFLRNLLGVKQGTSNWCLYREVGMYPMQLFCFRQMIRFVNKLDLMPDHTWAKLVLLEMVRDASQAGVSNWIADLVDFARRIGVGVRWPEGGYNLPEFQEAPCTAVLRDFYYNLFTDCGESE
jgi:hypothetical protein